METIKTLEKQIAEIERITLLAVIGLGVMSLIGWISALTFLIYIIWWVA